MVKFAINKNFDHAKAGIGKTGDVLEILKLDDDDYGVIIYRKNSCPEECGVYTLEELKAIYWILSE